MVFRVAVGRRSIERLTDVSSSVIFAKASQKFTFR
jgi:hypothetical protein